MTELATELADERIEKARRRLAGKSPAQQREILRRDWGKLLGPLTPAQQAVVAARSIDEDTVAGVRIERVALEVEAGIVVPLLVLRPDGLKGRLPVVVCLARAGKAGFLKERAGELEQLVRAGTVVVLPDLRGTGEVGTGEAHGPAGANLSAHVHLFGETLLGQRLRDLRSVLAYLRGREDLDARRLALWGDSFAPPNPKGTTYKVPRGVEAWPREADPLGGLLALFGGLFEDDVRAVYAAGGLTSYRSLLTHYAVLIPHDDAVPGALTAGDLSDVAAALAPRPVRLEASVDGMNRTLSGQRTSAAAWLLERLRER